MYVCIYIYIYIYRYTHKLLIITTIQINLSLSLYTYIHFYRGAAARGASGLPAGGAGRAPALRRAAGADGRHSIVWYGMVWYSIV